MRLLSYDMDQELIEKITDEELFICDVAEDMYDALYHAEVRFYNLIMIKSDSIDECKSFFKYISCHKTAFVVITSNTTKEFELELLKCGVISVIQEPATNEYILCKLESIYRDSFAKKIEYKNKFYIDNINKCVMVSKTDEELNISGKTFEVLFYLIKNKHRPPLHKDEIINAIWEEPEMVSDNVVEVNINHLRRILSKSFDTSYIDTVRNRGYKIAS